MRAPLSVTHPHVCCTGFLFPFFPIARASLPLLPLGAGSSQGIQGLRSRVLHRTSGQVPGLREPHSHLFLISASLHRSHTA
ncbi:RAB1B, member RAS oncogene family, isoform CRA_b [Mus musculus]|nr:RAB1B, member RAS oncogene family, isoform CRA_b [Mus musculus]